MGSTIPISSPHPINKSPVRIKVVISKFFILESLFLFNFLVFIFFVISKSILVPFCFLLFSLIFNLLYDQTCNFYLSELPLCKTILQTRIWKNEEAKHLQFLISLFQYLLPSFHIPQLPNLRLDFGKQTLHLLD